MTFNPPSGGSGGFSRPSPDSRQFSSQEPVQYVVLRSEKEPISGVAIASMVVGIVAVLAVGIPVVGFILASIGLLLASRAFRSIREYSTRGRGFAITGLVTSLVGFVISGIVTALLFWAYMAAMSYGPGGTTPFEEVGGGETTIEQLGGGFIVLESLLSVVG